MPEDEIDKKFAQEIAAGAALWASSMPDLPPEICRAHAKRAVTVKAQHASPCYHADELLKRYEFGPHRLYLCYGVSYTGNTGEKFINDISRGYYDKERIASADLTLPKNFAGMEDYADALLAVLKKIRDAGKPPYIETSEALLPKLSDEDKTILTKAPSYFQGLQVLAHEEVRLSKQVIADPKKRVKAIEKEAQHSAELMREVKAWNKNAKEKDGKDHPLAILTHQPVFDEAATLDKDDYQSADSGVRNRPHRIGRVIMALETMAEDTERLCKLLGLAGYRESAMSRGTGPSKPGL